jgi:fructose-1,6-bisphosphatase/inositol monophosphatase family enzyme
VAAPRIDVDSVSALLVEVSSRAIMPRFQALEAGDVAEKGPDDLVTVTDTEAEALVTEALLAAYPRVPVIGEEAVSADPRLVEHLDELETYWLLDPLDGTSNFVAGNPDFGTMLALVHGGDPVLAWLWLPMRDLMITAEKGGGAWSAGVRLEPSAASAPWATAAVRSWVSLRFLPPEVRAAVEENVRAFASVSAGPGSAVAAYPGLIRGEVAAALQWRTHPWDHAPGSLVLTEAGGAARRPDGRPYLPADPGSGLVMVARAEHWSDACAALLNPPRSRLPDTESPLKGADHP